MSDATYTSKGKPFERDMDYIPDRSRPSRPLLQDSFEGPR